MDKAKTILRTSRKGIEIEVIENEVSGVKWNIDTTEHDNQIKAEVIDLLKDDYGNCEGNMKCTNCMFSRYGKIDCVLDTELEEQK